MLSARTGLKVGFHFYNLQRNNGVNFLVSSKLGLLQLAFFLQNKVSTIFHNLHLYQHARGLYLDNILDNILAYFS